jgi:hypothetical protein
MQEAGWEVAIATCESYAPFVEERTRDVEFIPLLGNPSALINSPEFNKAFYEGGKPSQLASASGRLHGS